MSTNVYIRPGFWVKTSDAVKGALDFRAAMRDVMTSVNVPFSDSCCTPDANTQPVRYNASNLSIEHFNGQGWSVIPTGSIGIQPIPLAENVMASINAKAQFQGVPATANDTGSPGQIAFDTEYFYICVATDTWKRTSLATW